MPWPSTAAEFLLLDPDQRADVLLESLATCPDGERGRNLIVFAAQRWFPALQGFGPIPTGAATQQMQQQRHAVTEAMEDAYAVLSARTLIVPDPRAGTTFCRLTQSGLAHLQSTAMPDAERVRFAARALDGLTLQSALSKRHVDTHFLQGKYETALRDCATYIEDAVRTLGAYGAGDIGVKLMSKAFAKAGPLSDQSAHAGQQTGVQRLFEGFFGAVRNLIAHTGHRYSDPKEAFQLLMLADLLVGELAAAAARTGQTLP